MSKSYHLFGLTLSSAIDLPELDLGNHIATPDVTILLEAAPASFNMPAQEIISDLAGSLTLNIPRVGQFQVANGRTIVVRKFPGVSDADLRLFLLGSAIGLLLHQRAILPLHANAVELGGMAVAFMGRSGVGKSTLAASFHDAGHAILSDDVCAVATNGQDFFVEPGIPRLKLWRDAMQRSGRQCDEGSRVKVGLDKFGVATAAGCRVHRLPLGAVYMLARADEESAVEISRLSGAAAMTAIISNIYRGHYIRHTPHSATQFEKIAGLVATVPIYHLYQPWSPERIEGTIAAITDHQSGRGSLDRDRA